MKKFARFTGRDGVQFLAVIADVVGYKVNSGLEEGGATLLVKMPFKEEVNEIFVREDIAQASQELNSKNNDSGRYVIFSEASEASLPVVIDRMSVESITFATKDTSFIHIHAGDSVIPVRTVTVQVKGTIQEVVKAINA